MDRTRRWYLLMGVGLKATLNGGPIIGVPWKCVISVTGVFLLLSNGLQAADFLHTQPGPDVPKGLHQERS